MCLFCPCVCRVHIHVHAQPTEHQDSSWTRDYYSSPAFDNRMAPWWVDREVIVWCELFQPQSWHTDYLNSSTCIVLPSLPWLLFSLLCDNPNKQFHSLSFHFSLHSNSSLGLIAGFASFLSLSPSSPPSSISGLINTSTTRCFHCAKRNFYTPTWEACVLAAGKPVCPGKVWTAPKYICRHRISNMSICKPPFMT